MSGYDIIGDVHGQGKKLVGLLQRLGYEKSKGVYHHRDRQAIFVGDLIDRGDRHADVLAIVKKMQTSGAAQVVMGNHEFNAIAYATEDPRHPGQFMRTHSEKNSHGHRHFLEQFTSKERAKWIKWFKTLPLWLDLDEGIRVVHACWHEPSIRVVERALANEGLTKDEFFVEAATKKNELYDAVEVLLKGPELSLKKYDLPGFLDNGGHRRTHARIRWWIDDVMTVKELAEIQHDAQREGGGTYPQIDHLLCDERELAYGYRGSKPVFFGHYWRAWTPTRTLDWTDTAACVDFSAGRGGLLVAYRWDGEHTLSDTKYVEFPEDPLWTKR